METATTPSQAAIKAGVVTGLILTVITFLCYFIDWEILVATWFNLGSFVLYCALIIYFGIQYRTDLGGFMSFGTAFQFAFVSLIVMLIINTLGSMLLFLVLDPGLGERMADLSMENTLKMMGSFGAGDLPSDQMDEIRNGIAEAYTAWGMIKGTGFMLIIYAILALILGAIIKKKDKSLDY
jgi:hypothetical protein